MARIPGLLLIAGSLWLVSSAEAAVYKCQDAAGWSNQQARKIV